MSLTLIVVAITVIVSYLAWQRPALMSRLILWPPAVSRNNQYDRLVTYGFIHADGMHLFFNMFTLYFFGRVVEHLFGMFGFVVFYLAALVVSVLPSYLAHRNDSGYRSLGASGAVSACLFAFIVVAPWEKIYLYYGAIGIPAIIYAVLYVAYSIWMDRRGQDNVNHSAHLWGAAFGVLAVLLAVPGAASQFLQALAHPGG
ncbi:rhomboid family intramembrane serine protease [Solilutibacter silvestris]|uniref:Peptidase S54 rhomboid domain-containing protein n=1 Tax=Solilutibacter silvestris TaxID=1645665 RepID=A0A2K1PXW9_9GAMM|nr:rhomboid family intramembrane serine protease [Lysobacter silvestris]PNS07629.1 hypothetical protein Lysil_1805 [Lysobacter silvestris]